MKRSALWLAGAFAVVLSAGPAAAQSNPVDVYKQLQAPSLRSQVMSAFASVAPSRGVNPQIVFANPGSNAERDPLVGLVSTATPALFWILADSEPVTAKFSVRTLGARPSETTIDLGEVSKPGLYRVTLPEGLLTEGTIYKIVLSAARVSNDADYNMSEGYIRLVPVPDAAALGACAGDAICEAETLGRQGYWYEAFGRLVSAPGGEQVWQAALGEQYAVFQAAIGAPADLKPR